MAQLHLEINGQHQHFWQWDVNRQLIVEDAVCEEVHFCNGTTESALVCEIFQLDGRRLVNVPNILLQSDNPLTAYLYERNEDEGLTQHRQTFKVYRRNKPADYVYTETEVKSWESLDERVRALEQGGGSSVSFDWNAAEGEPGHVLNRTHWTETALTPIVEDKSYALVMQTNPPATTYPETAAKQEIKNLPLYAAAVVVFDGVTYECPVVPTDDGGCYVGNYDVAEGAEYPFYFGVVKNKLSGKWLLVRATEGTYHTASIYGKEEIVHKIDPKYLPETITNGGLNITEDEEGNVTIVSTGDVSITDDGDGNVVIE